MLQRFRAFLELEFRELQPTKESEDYKAELLGVLMDCADEMKKNGETDEDKIYNESIARLGDFKANFSDFKTVPAVKKHLRSSLNFLLWAVVYVLIFTAAFLIVGFTAAPWSKAWLILVCGVLAGIMGVSIYLAVVSSRKKRFIVTRIFSAVTSVLGVLIIYLCFSVLYPNAWSVSWLLFLFLPIILPGVDLILAIATESKTLILDLLVFIITAATMIYVIFGVTAFLPWHPYWFIPVVAFVADVVIAAVAVKMKFLKK